MKINWIQKKTNLNIETRERQNPLTWVRFSRYNVPRFNGQSLNKVPLIIVVVLLGAVKTHVALVEALRKKERQDETKLVF
jgi:hypothetical protein